jgi:effector-binding domain-containing protein
MDTSSVMEIGQKFEADFDEIRDYIEQLKIKQAGPPFAIYYDFKNDTMVFKAAIPTNKNLRGNGRVNSIEIKGGRAVVAYYQGSFKNIGQVHGAINKMITDKKLIMNGPPWEVYLTDPSVEKDPNRWLTEVYYPIK